MQLRRNYKWIVNYHIPLLSWFNTYSSQSLTLSSCDMGIVLICMGVRWKSLNTNTRSKFLRPNCTRSKWAISISLSVITRKGGSDRWTRQSVVGCKRTLDRNGTPLKPSSRKGMSTSIRFSLWSFAKLGSQTSFIIYAWYLLLQRSFLQKSWTPCSGLLVVDVLPVRIPIHLHLHTYVVVFCFRSHRIVYLKPRDRIEYPVKSECQISVCALIR